MERTGTTTFLIRCPNCQNQDWHVFPCKVTVWPDKEVTYGGRCPGCSFYVWDAWSLKSFMLPLRYQSRSQTLVCDLDNEQGESNDDNTPL